MAKSEFIYREIFLDRKFLKLKMIHVVIILCGKSIVRIPEALKFFLDPDSGNVVGVLTRKSKNFLFMP